jgi:hypothetical protein
MKRLLVSLAAAAFALAARAADPAPAAPAAPAEKPAEPAAAIEVPTAAEVRRVLDYFDNGKGRGPVLADLKLCSQVETKKDSPRRFECTEEVKGKVKHGTTVHAWMQWFVPKDDKYDDVSIQFAHQGTVRSTQDLQLGAAMKTRTYKSQNLSKPGTWEVKVIRGDKELGKVSVEVE